MCAMSIPTRPPYNGVFGCRAFGYFRLGFASWFEGVSIEACVVEGLRLNGFGTPWEPSSAKCESSAFLGVHGEGFRA